MVKSVPYCCLHESQLFVLAKVDRVMFGIIIFWYYIKSDNINCLKRHDIANTRKIKLLANIHRAWENIGGEKIGEFGEL